MKQLLLGLALAFQASGVITAGNIVLDGFGGGGFSVNLATSSVHFESQGKPLKLSVTDQGVTISGRAMKGDADTSKKGNYVISQAHVSGDSLWVRDQGQVVAYLTANKLPIPKEMVDSTEHAELHTEQFDYTTVGNTGSLSMPDKLVLTEDRSGTIPATDKKAATQFTQTTLFEGAKGGATVLLDPKPVNGPLRTAAIDGPVHIHSVRTEKTDGNAVPTIQTIDATADHLDLDFTQPEGRIILKGHVKVDYVEQDLHFTGDSLVLITDEQRQPIRMQGLGSPTETRGHN